MWEVTSGVVDISESSSTGALRELKEELGIKVNKNDLQFIGSYARINDFVEVFLLKSNISISNLKLQEDEVQAAKWVKVEEFEKIIKDGNASDTGYFIFTEYYNKFYNTYVFF